MLLYNFCEKGKWGEKHKNFEGASSYFIVKKPLLFCCFYVRQYVALFIPIAYLILISDFVR